MNVLRFFSTAQGTQAWMLAINTSFFTQNHVKQVVVEKEEWERNNAVFFMTSRRARSFLKKSPLSFFTVKIPGSRDRKDVWRSQSFCYSVSLKTTWPPTLLLMLGPSVWSPRTSCALRVWHQMLFSNETTSRPDVHWSATGRHRSVHFHRAVPHGNLVKIYRGVHKLCFQISKTTPDAIYWNTCLLIFIVYRCCDNSGFDDCIDLLFPASSVELATSFKCPLRGTSVNVKACLHPCKNVAHLCFAAASCQIINLSDR